MPDILIETPASEYVTPAATDDAPLSAHIEAFHKDTLEPKTEQAAPDKDPRRRNRAAKDIAHPGDVPRIRELTGKVKDAETRAEKAEREAGEWKQKFEATSRPAPKADAAPVPDKFAYQSYEEAFAADNSLEYQDWDDQRKLALFKWDQAKGHQAAAQDAQQRQQQESEDDAIKAWTVKRDAYTTQYPDRMTAFQNLPSISSPVLVAAILKHDNGPDLVYRLRQQPDVFEEAVLFAHGKPVDEFYVAAMQRWLQKRVSAGTTGAVPSAQTVNPAPRPPTPVRTTPVPPTDEPPGENASLRDHQRYFHADKRR